MPRDYALFEYIWIDGDNELRSKTRVFFDTDSEFSYKLGGDGIVPSPYDLPEWSFDGSSTKQAEGYDSDVFIKPQFVCIDPFNTFGQPAFLVMCDTYNKDGTPHVTNTRVECVDVTKRATEHDVWFGFEQEMYIYDNKTHNPVGWDTKKYNEQGRYYCSSGGDNLFIRNIMIEHMTACLKAGLHVRGMNSEVGVSQTEIQIGELNAIDASDELWICRYIMNRVCERYNCYAVLHPKPLEDRETWNGSGNHTNISTNLTRKLEGDELDKEITNLCEKMKQKHSEHLKVYGNPEMNKLRLTGKHETASFEKFMYGDNHRGCSIRTQKGKVYFEDRRPASNMDPYKVTSRIIKTMCLDE
jgi:glutamine synthetase